MDRQSEMAVFVGVVDGEGFSAAARKMGMTPSAVSKLIGRLEDRLGTRLLNRTTRKVSLTEEGRAYYDRAVRILEDIDAAEREIADLRAEPQGILRVHSSTAFGEHYLVPVIHEFFECFPKVEIHLELSDTLIDLVGQGVDLALRIGALTDSSLLARKILPVHRIVAGAPSYFDRYGVPKKPDDLVHHNCMRVSFETALNRWEFLGPDGPRQVQVSGSLQVSDSAVLFSAALAGVGLIRASHFLLGPAIADGRLIPVLQKYETNQELNVFAVYPPGRHASPKLRAFVDFLIEKFRSDPSWQVKSGIG